MTKIPTGAGSDIVKKEMDEVYGVVAKAWDQRKATVEEVTAPGPFAFTQGGTPVAYYSVHKINYQGVQNISISLLTGCGGQFVKLRYTYPGKDVDEARHHLSLFLYALLEANRESLDPIFVPSELELDQALQPTAPTATQAARSLAP